MRPEGTSLRSGAITVPWMVLSLDSVRVPVAAVDINTRTGDVVNIMKVGKATAWKDVPTPAIRAPNGPSGAVAFGSGAPHRAKQMRLVQHDHAIKGLATD